MHPENFYERQRITLLTGTEVVRIDAGRRIARLADGRDLPYSRCLLATGGRARELPGLPRARPACITSARWTTPPRCASLAPQARVAVIGGGFLGLEVASTARALGAEVSVLESAPRLLERVLPEALSDWLAERVRHAGVDLRLGARIAGCDRQPHADAAIRHQARFLITLQDAATVAADIVVVAIGLTPEVSLAVQAGLALDPANGGIAVNAACRSSDPHLYAAGDCASQHRSRLGMALRLESWQNANEQARAAAACWASPLPPNPIPGSGRISMAATCRCWACPSPAWSMPAAACRKHRPRRPDSSGSATATACRCTLSR